MGPRKRGGCASAPPFPRTTVAVGRSSPSDVLNTRSRCWSEEGELSCTYRMDEFSAMAPSPQQDRFSASSPSGSDSAGFRHRRHLPSPALAQAKSLLKLSNTKQTYAHSFDISELSGLRLSSGSGSISSGMGSSTESRTGRSMASSPSAPVVSSSSLLSTRRLPVPLTGLSTGVTDAMDEMDALIGRCSSNHLFGSATASSGKLSSASSSSSSSGSSNRKLPVPPVSAAALAMQNHHSSRRLLPRPLSCDVPGVGVNEADLLGGLGGHLTPRSGSHLFSSQQRPYSFDFAPPDLELEGSSLALLDDGYAGGGGSDPSLMMLMQESLKSSVHQQRIGLIRQSSTTSCPALVRPCVSPRSPKFRSSEAGSFSSYSLSFNGGGGGSSSTTTPSPHPSYPSLAPVSGGDPSMSSSTSAYLSAPGTFVPLVQQLTPHTPPPSTALSPVPSQQHPLHHSASASTSPYMWPSTLGGTDNFVLGPSANATTVTIPSIGSAFRPPPLAPPTQLAFLQQHHRQAASLPPSIMVDGALNPESGLSFRRHRYHQGCGGEGSASFYASAQEYSHLSLDLNEQQHQRERTSRSRVTARGGLGIGFMAR